MSFEIIDKIKVTDVIKTPVDYFDFPNSAEAFCYSLKNSSPFIFKNMLFRKRNKNLTLVTFDCSGPELLAGLECLQTQGYKIKSLNYANKDLSGLKTRFYMNEFYVLPEYNLDWVLTQKKGKPKRKLRSSIRKSRSKYFIDEDLEIKECARLFKRWVDAAKKRHFMVIKGHYLKYIEMFFSCKTTIKLIGFRKSSDGSLYGLAGYEYFKGCCQITLMKHIIDEYDQQFANYFWSETLAFISKTYHPKKIFCGTTADVLKKKLLMAQQKSWKIVL